MTLPSGHWWEVPPAWGRCFELAWEAFRVRAVAVGAVLVDPAGEPVAEGRNRRSDTAPVPGQLTGSNIAHAELNALAALPPGHYEDHVLYTTLEPCLLCTAALRYSHVGTVRFAAADPMWYDLDRIAELNHHIARRWTVRDGPLDGPLSTFAAVLPLIDAVDRGIASVIGAYADSAPRTLALARAWSGPTADELRQLSLPDALASVWSDLESAASGTPSSR